MIRKRIPKPIFVSLIVILMLMFGALSASAYSGDYSFDIVASVSGTNTHSLSSLSTSTTVGAESYWNSYVVSSTKYNYTVKLYKNILTSYSTPQIKADGYSYTKSYGVISSGSYTIHVTKNTGDSTNRVVGEGTINQ